MSNYLKRFLVLAMLIMFGLIMIFPFYWNIAASFMPVWEMFRSPPSLIPRIFTLENFMRIRVHFPNLPRNILNSLFLASVMPLLGAFITSLAGFAFAKYDFIGRRVLFSLIIATMMLPTIVNFIPLFILMVRFGLVDNYLAIILPGIAGAFGVFLFRQAIFGVPDEMIDAARIDGANDFKVYYMIILPLVRPMLMTIIIINFIGVLNDYFWPFIILRTAARLTFPVVLAGLQGLFFDPPWGAIMVGSVILTLPTIVIFSALSKYIIPDIMGGAVKG